MSGECRLHREQKMTKGDRVLFLVMVGVVAIGIAATLEFAHLGWIVL
jgi:hypothetical protein